jgi:hypothetical protein
MGEELAENVRAMSNISKKKCCVEYLRIGATICETCLQTHGRNFEHILDLR